MLRVVFDPGVLISAVLSGQGPPGRAFDRWRDGEFDLVVAPLLLAELERALERTKLRRHISAEQARAFVEALGRLAIVVDDPPAEPGLTPDPGDDYLVALARSTADLIVSGDRHLAALPAGLPRVVAPGAFVEFLAGR